MIELDDIGRSTTDEVRVRYLRTAVYTDAALCSVVPCRQTEQSIVYLLRDAGTGTILTNIHDSHYGPKS